MRITDTSDLWWKTAVIYCLDIETYYDANGDGVGDVVGLTERVGYLADLGVTCIWLMPFYASPDKDDGYDISDYLTVDPRLGDVGLLVELVHLAHARGIKVIADLVINHTSDQHPWFKASRREKDPAKNPFRAYYVWRDTEPGNTSSQVVFPDKEDSIWEQDEKTGEWYLHHFYRFQPDLNLDEPAVIAEIERVVGYWLQLGFDGFRVDGVPFLAQTAAEMGDDEFTVNPHTIMTHLRRVLSRRNGRAMMLGEVNLPRKQQLAFFGGSDADELHMQFDFITMQATYLAMARADARPIIAALRDRPTLPRSCQWANFLRNHDELTLDKLSDAEREEVFAAFGPEENMQVYDRGLKRRLPPMLEGDPRRVRMAYALMFALPGTPTLFYGEEIGMGEDLAEEGRMAVRSPMQWSAEKNGGFSHAAPSKLVQRVVPGPYAPEHVNVQAQLHDEGSLLALIRRLIHIRRARPEFGWGELSILEHDGDPGVLAHRLDIDRSAVLAVHHIGPDPTTVTLPVSGFGDDVRIVDLGTQERLSPLVGTGDPMVEVTLAGYGWQWLRLSEADDHAIP